MVLFQEDKMKKIRRLLLKRIEQHLDYSYLSDAEIVSFLNYIENDIQKYPRESFSKKLKEKAIIRLRKNKSNNKRRGRTNA